MIFTFLIFTLIGIIVWDYVGTNSNPNPHNYFSFSFLKKKPEPVEEIKLEKQSLKRKGDVNVLSRTDSVQHENENSILPKTLENETKILTEVAQTPTTDSIEITGTKQDFVIKKDQLLISYELSVLEIKSDGEKTGEKDNPTQSMAQNVVDKLNPAAGLVENVVAGDGFDVEFWISPINYRGYKLIQNKLILFGIEEPDAVKLIRFDGILFMKYGNEYYRLWPGSEFMAYQKIKEVDLPLSLKQ